jgi:hypothetical protein
MPASLRPEELADKQRPIIYVMFHSAIFKAKGLVSVVLGFWSGFWGFTACGG